MEFFKSIEEIIGDTQLTFTIAKKDDILVVSVLPKINPGQKSEKPFSPMIFRGPAIELDERFIGALQVPMQTINQIQVELSDFEKSVNDAKSDKKTEKPKSDTKPVKESKPKKKKKELTAEEINELKFKFLMAKADEFEALGELRDAIGAMNEAKDYTTRPKDIKSIDESIDSHTKTLVSGELFPDIDGIKRIKSFLIEQEFKMTVEVNGNTETFDLKPSDENEETDAHETANEPSTEDLE